MIKKIKRFQKKQKDSHKDFREVYFTVLSVSKDWMCNTLIVMDLKFLINNFGREVLQCWIKRRCLWH